MACYEIITEDEGAASAPTCRVCGFRTTHRQDADDLWTCAECAADEVVTPASLRDLLAPLPGHRPTLVISSSYGLIVADASHRTAAHFHGDTLHGLLAKARAWVARQRAAQQALAAEYGPC
jgi:hypothetical protein